MKRQAVVAIVLAAAAASLPGPPGAAGPVPAAGHEKVEVRIVQVEVTAVPRDDRVSCADLSPGDLELTVNGRPRAIAGFDPVGEVRLPAVTPGQDRRPEGPPPLQVVLVFDAMSLQWPVPCGADGLISPGIARHMTIRWARSWVREGMRPGDRVAVVVLGSGVRFVSSWRERPAEVLDVLDALEEDAAAWPAHLFLLQDGPSSLCGFVPMKVPNYWWRAWRDLLTALEQTPGTKQILRLAGQPVVSLHGTSSAEFALRSLAARLQAAHAVLHDVDPFVVHCAGRPIWARARVSEGTGGEHFVIPRHAAERLREIAACRFLLSFPVEPEDEEPGAARTIRLTDRTGRFRFRQPGTWEPPRDAPTPGERAASLLLLPELHRGLEAAARVVPLRPDAEGKRWRGVLLARLRWRRDAGLPPTLPDGLVVEMTVLEGSRVVANRVVTLAADEVRTLATDPRGRTWAVPVPLRPGRWYDGAVLAHPPGDWREAVLAAGRSRKAEPSPRIVGAWFREGQEVPRLPRPGRPGPLLLVDRLARVGNRIVPAPAFGDEVEAGRTPLFLSWACSRRKDGHPRPLEGAALVPLGAPGAAGAALPPAEIPVTFSWHPDPERPDCGWWMGAPGRPPAPGRWELRVPGDGLDPGPSLRFRVRPLETSGAGATGRSRGGGSPRPSAPPPGGGGSATPSSRPRSGGGARPPSS